MKDIQVSLYDVFGYVFPGATALFGVYLVATRIFPSMGQDWALVTAGGWVALLAVAYLLGHLIQALANALMRFEKQSPEERILGQSSKELRQVLILANNRVKGVLGITGDADLDPRTLYHAMDHFLLQNGRTAARDIYVYREGFYRGMTVSSLLLSAGCFVAATGVQVAFAAFGFHLLLSPSLMIICGVGGIVAAILGFWRYQRFADYRVRNALYGFLTVRPAQKEDEQ